jgi:hypothetical protein
VIRARLTGGQTCPFNRGPGESWALTTRETMSTTTTRHQASDWTKARYVEFLQAVASGSTKAQGFKRPTVAALQQAAKALGLPDRIDHAPYGYHVGHGRLISPCDDLKAAASALLTRLPRAPYVTAGQAALALAADREALALKEAQAAHRAAHAPILPGENAAPAAPAPLAPAPVLPKLRPRLNATGDVRPAPFPAFISYSQQRQQP